MSNILNCTSNIKFCVVKHIPRFQRLRHGHFPSDSMMMEQIMKTEAEETARVCNCISCAEEFWWSSSWIYDPISGPICMRGFADLSSPCPHLFICPIFVCVCFIQNNITLNESVIFSNIWVVLLNWKHFPLNITHRGLY